MTDLGSVFFKGSPTPLIITTGIETFAGNDTDEVLTGFLHGLAEAPIWWAVNPAGGSGGSFWAAEWGESAPANGDSVFVGFFTAGDNTGASTSVSIPGQNVTDSNGDTISIPGQSISVPGGPHYTFGSGFTYTYRWIALGLGQ